MQPLLFEKFEDLSMEDLPKQIAFQYLSDIEALCHQAIGYVEEMLQDTQLEHSELFVSLSAKTINEIFQQIRLRKQVLYPYIVEISKKAAASHDCSQCSGGCHMQHESTLLMYKEGVNRLRQQLYSLMQLQTHASVENEGDNRTKKRLTHWMVMIENKVNEWLHLEASVLIPKLDMYRKKINAA